MIKIRIKEKMYLTEKLKDVTTLIRKKKNTKFYKNTRNNCQGFPGNNYKIFKPLNLAAKEREPPTTFNKNNA